MKFPKKRLEGEVSQVVWYWKEDKKDLAYIGDCLNGKRHGNGKAFNTNGSLWCIGDWYKDMIDDNIQTYYENGKMKFKGRFVRGNKHGFGVKYFGNGQIYYVGVYDNGDIVEESRFFRKNGEIFSVEVF